MSPGFPRPSRRAPISSAGTVLLTGGTGFLGRSIIERLLGEGERVKGLARSESAATALRELGAEAVRGDVLDPEALAAAM